VPQRKKKSSVLLCDKKVLSYLSNPFRVFYIGWFPFFDCKHPADFLRGHVICQQRNQIIFAWAQEEALTIRNKYYKGKFVVGIGPTLE
jgi:hypothetical protein